MLFCFTDNKYDARKNLSDIQNQITEKNLKINFGAEVEFFLFKTKNGKIDIENIANNCYFQQIDGIYRKCLEDISNFCKGKIILEAIHHECGINQFEIDFKYDNPLQTADNIIFLKNVIRYFAEKYELKSCFMPKPLNNASGSGMHINMSVFSDNENLFYDKNDVNHLSNFAYRYITNIFKHISAITALTNPNVNSYKRLNSGFETPTSVEYSAKNRSVLIRLPKATKNTTRVELRSPDISCNPYLAFAGILLAGFENIFADDIASCKIPSRLPKNLQTSIGYLKDDNLINQLVPDSYIDKKLLEIQFFDSTVTDAEIEKYFNI